MSIIMISLDCQYNSRWCAFHLHASIPLPSAQPSKPVSNPDLSEYNLQGSEGACEIRAIVKASSSTNHGLMTYSTCMHKTHQRPGSPISRSIDRRKKGMWLKLVHAIIATSCYTPHFLGTLMASQGPNKECLSS